MPLRDHFRSPLDDRHSWDVLHGLWPGMITLNLNGRLPPHLVAGPNVHLGGAIEVDIGTLESENFSGFDDTAGGGTATAVWAAAAPTLVAEADFSQADEYEVRVFDAARGRRLVAAVEIVSPSNLDRPATRRAFAAKCAELLRQRVAVVVVDVVTTQAANAYVEILAMVGRTDPAVPTPGPIYAAAFRPPPRAGRPFEAWYHPLAVGTPLPTLPLWVAEDLVVPLELEETYESTCRGLRIA